jgi:hypothetical protein
VTATKSSPFTEPQRRGARIRRNGGSWNPLVDLADIYAGNRSTDRRGVYDLFDAPVGVSLRVEPADRSEPLLEADAPWEAGGSIGPLFLWKTDDGFHMLYETKSGTGYATSDDAYGWKRPDLGEVEVGGSSANNILEHGIVGSTGVFIDSHAPSEERFKAMGGDMAWYDPATCEPLGNEEAQKRYDAQEYGGDTYDGPRAEIWGRMLGWTSPDGRRWEALPEALGNRPVNGGISARWDDATKQYICYQQTMGFEAEALKGIGSASVEEETTRRTIAFSCTKDFRAWPAPKQIVVPDAQDPLDIDFYGANYFPYPGRTDLHTMIIPVFYRATDHVDTQIAFSRDGLFWTRPERRTLHGVGVPGSGDDCQVHSWRSGLVELPDGSWAVPYTGLSDLHNVREEFQAELFPQHRPIQIRYALWQPHRLCGIEAELEGRFTVPTIYRSGDQLRLNYRCAPGGWIAVELFRKTPTRSQPDLEPLSGFSFAECDRLIGDEADRAVTWNGNSDISMIGETVCIRVKLFQAKLFAYKL